jgi:hypothetical protein
MMTKGEQALVLLLDGIEEVEGIKMMTGLDTDTCKGILLTRDELVRGPRVYHIRTPNGLTINFSTYEALMDYASEMKNCNGCEVFHNGEFLEDL